MKIIEPHSNTGWITVEIDGYEVEAKVYDNPSSFGINGGRVSKMVIRKQNKAIYNYDRGLDFSKVSEKLVNKIVSDLETLPNCC